MAILTEASHTTPVVELAALVRRIGLTTPNEAAAMIRADRDGRRR